MRQGDENWIPGYGVRCNNCFMYFKDDDDIPAIYDSEHEPGHRGLTCCGCPSCMTDEYLMDAEEYQGGIWKDGCGAALTNVDTDEDVTVHRDGMCLIIKDSGLGEIALGRSDAKELIERMDKLIARMR